MTSLGLRYGLCAGGSHRHFTGMLSKFNYDVAEFRALVIVPYGPPLRRYLVTVRLRHRQRPALRVLEAHAEQDVFLRKPTAPVPDRWTRHLQHRTGHCTGICRHGIDLPEAMQPAPGQTERKGACSRMRPSPVNGDRQMIASMTAKTTASPMTAGVTSLSLPAMAFTRT